MVLPNLLYREPKGSHGRLVIPPQNLQSTEQISQESIDEIVNKHLADAPSAVRSTYASILREAQYANSARHAKLYGASAAKYRGELADILERSSQKYLPDLKDGLLKTGMRGGSTIALAAADIGEYFGKWGSGAGYITRAIRAVTDVGHDLYQRVKYSTGLGDLVKNLAMGAVYAGGRIGASFLTYMNPFIPGLGWTPVGAIADEAAAQILNRTIGVRALAKKKVKYDALSEFDQLYLEEEERNRIRHYSPLERSTAGTYNGLRRHTERARSAVRSPAYALGNPSVN